jgi:HD-like signal output (HDOD) protein
MPHERVPPPKYRLRELAQQCRELIRLSSTAEPDLREITGQIRQAPLLEARVVRYVNSIGVGLKNRVSRIDHAVALLGAARIRSLAERLLQESSQSPAAEDPSRST